MSTAQVKIAFKDTDKSGVKDNLDYACKILTGMNYKLEAENTASATVDTVSFISLMGMLQTYCNKVNTSLDVSNSKGEKLTFSPTPKGFNFAELEKRVLPLLN